MVDLDTGGRDGTHDKVLEQGFVILEVNVGTPCEIRGLLEEDWIGSENLAHVYRDLLGGKLGLRGWMDVGLYSLASGREKLSS